MGGARADLSRILSRNSPFADADAYAPGQETLDFLHTEANILIIGAGGLGCEIVKAVALSGFTKIHIIDMDHVDLTNLNRQFLFRQRDVGRPKAEVAAAFVNERCGHLGVNVEFHTCPIQDKGDDFYRQFNIVIAGLDNIKARRWMNATLHEMVARDANGDVDPTTIIPLIDGGTEGLKGQARVILPTMTSCFDCSLESFPPQVNFPLCTIAETPRLPEHCIEYALVILWDKTFPAKKVNNDSAEDIRWLFEQAQERAEAFGIEGVTYQLTLGVVKRIIPAVASTNAVIAALLVQEAIKIMSYGGPVMNNYMMYMGHNGLYTHTFQYEKNPECMVCGAQVLTLKRSPDTTLQGLIDTLCADPRLQLTKPSISSGENIVFVQNAALRPHHEHKLPQTLRELVSAGIFAEGEELVVTDPVLPSVLRARVVFE